MKSGQRGQLGPDLVDVVARRDHECRPYRGPEEHHIADLLLIAHLAFVVFVAVGGLLVMRWPRAAWIQLPAAAWGVAVEAFGWTCPLTPIEDELRRSAGEVAAGGDFIARTILPVLYPEGLTRDGQLVLAATALVVNLGIYANAGSRSGGRFAIARYLWALPNTLVGLVLAAAAMHGGAARLVDGVLEVHGPLVGAILRRLVPLAGGPVAITFGHIVAAETRSLLHGTRAHERVHVGQCERWGPVFIPVYLLASAWSWLRGSGAYWGNYFERQARAEELSASRRIERGSG